MSNETPTYHLSAKVKQKIWTAFPKKIKKKSFQSREKTLLFRTVIQDLKQI